LLKLCALSSYSSFPFNPVNLPLLNQKKATAPVIVIAAIKDPITIPATAPFDSLLDSAAGGAEDAGPDGPAVGEDRDVTVVLELGVINSSLVTLKQGGFIVISVASTNVFIILSATLTDTLVHFFFWKNRSSDIVLTMSAHAKKVWFFPSFSPAKSDQYSIWIVAFVPEDMPLSCSSL
jgi:hypothetical protein